MHIRTHFCHYCNLLPFWSWLQYLTIVESKQTQLKPGLEMNHLALYCSVWDFGFIGTSFLVLLFVSALWFHLLDLFSLLAEWMTECLRRAAWLKGESAMATPNSWPLFLVWHLGLMPVCYMSSCIRSQVSRTHNIMLYVILHLLPARIPALFLGPDKASNQASKIPENNNQVLCRGSLSLLSGSH